MLKYSIPKIKDFCIFYYALEVKKMKKLGLYIHIPFCTKKCDYCNFCSLPRIGGGDINSYFSALEEEILSYKDQIENYKVQTVYFGGGTPSCVPEKYIERIVTVLAETFRFSLKDPTLEKTIEVNPESASLKKLQTYINLGINRLSMGLQATQDRLLKGIGRTHTIDGFLKAYDHAIQAGFDNISVDLMMGLPEQTIEDVGESVEFVTQLDKIQHISAYSLKIEDDTILEKKERAGLLVLPSEEEERQMAYLMESGLRSKGFNQYEISNFAKPNQESRHNSAYWDLSDYIGLGLGASSYFQDRRFSNFFGMEAYCSALEKGESAILEDHLLDQMEKMGDWMFLGLRRTKGVSDREFQQMFGKSFFVVYKKEIEKLVNLDLIWKKEDRIGLTRRGLDLANQVFMEFV